MFRDHRRLDAPELDAFHEALEIRYPSLRICVQNGRNVATDYALLERASPFIHRLQKPCLTILLEGRGRFEEARKSGWIEGGDIVVSDQKRAGTEAYAGAVCDWIVMDWAGGALGVDVDRGFEVTRLSARDLRRVRVAAASLSGPRFGEGVLEILAVLRSVGLPFERLTLEDLADRPSEDDARLQDALSKQLSGLSTHPAIEDLADELGWNPRLVHRRIATIADRYALPWSHWRSALHHTRLLQAFRLLSSPRSTTETVARLTGFRSPSGLCHALSKAGLPSPGVLAREARRDVLDRWSAYGAKLDPAAMQRSGERQGTRADGSPVTDRAPPRTSR